MSYQDKLDRKLSIRCAKKEMEDFSDLIKLHESDIYRNIQSIKYNDVANIVSLINYDQKYINEIGKRDDQLDHINKVLNAINKLDHNYMEILFLKHISMKSDEDICDLLGLSIRSYSRRMNDSLFYISIALNIAVYKYSD